MILHDVNVGFNMILHVGFPQNKLCLGVVLVFCLDKWESGHRPKSYLQPVASHGFPWVPHGLPMALQQTL